MALILHPSSSSLATNKPHLLLHPQIHRKPINYPIKSQQNPETPSDPSTKNSGTPSTGLGFGPSAGASKKQSKGKRASIIRREPAEKPVFATPKQLAQAEEAQKTDSAFLLTWLALGSVILIEGIALAASGFLPEAWDKFLVKYLYPSFTPTVFLFVAGTVGYGVSKYLSNESSNTEN